VIYLPVSLLLFLVFLLLLPFIWFALTIDVVQTAAAKLGFSPTVALLLLILILLGSTINLPLYRIEARIDPVEELFAFYRQQFWGIPFHRIRQTTIVALNVGGGLIPVLLALYQFTQASATGILLVTAIVTGVSYFAAQVVPGIGIQMNPLLAPLRGGVGTCSMGYRKAFWLNPPVSLR